MEKEAWKDRILGSLEGIQKAIPREGLLADIENKITAESTPIISIYQWRITATAAILLLMANFWSVQQLINVPIHDSKEIVRNKPMLISNYKLYEQ